MEDKEGRGKKRLISNFALTHSRKSIHKSKKKKKVDKQPKYAIMSK